MKICQTFYYVTKTKKPKTETEKKTKKPETRIEETRNKNQFMEIGKQKPQNWKWKQVMETENRKHYSN